MSATEDILRDIFRRHGTVLSTTVMHSDEYVSNAFIEMKRVSDAKNALEAKHDTLICGTHCQIDYHKENMSYVASTQGIVSC